MTRKTNKPDLRLLPRHIISHGKHFYKNTKTGNLIPATRITEYLPIPPPDHEVIMSKRYDLRANS